METLKVLSDVKGTAALKEDLEVEDEEEAVS